MLSRALWLGRVLIRVDDVTLSTICGSITVKEGLSITLYRIDTLLVYAPGGFLNNRKKNSFRSSKKKDGDCGGILLDGNDTNPIQK